MADLLIADALIEQAMKETGIDTFDNDSWAWTPSPLPSTTASKRAG